MKLHKTTLKAFQVGDYVYPPMTIPTVSILRSNIQTAQPFYRRWYVKHAQHLRRRDKIFARAGHAINRKVPQ